VQHDSRRSAVLRRWNYVTWKWVLKVRFVGFDWNHHAYHIVHWWPFVNTVMKLCVSLNHGIIFFFGARWETVSFQDRPCVLELLNVTLLVTGWIYINYSVFSYFLNRSISNIIVEFYERKSFKLTLLGIRTYYNHYSFSAVVLSGLVGWRGQEWVSRLRYLIDVSKQDIISQVWWKTLERVEWICEVGPGLIVGKIK
jgi:hypothetical protein